MSDLQAESSSAPTRVLAALCIAVGLVAGGYFIGHHIGQGFVDAKALERSVVVKGLAEKDVAADTAIWPIQLLVADNDLTKLLTNVEKQTNQVLAFLKAQGFAAAEISVNAPSITDKQAQNYGNGAAPFRYTATAVITLYSKQVDKVRGANKNLIELGKAGIVFTQNNYEYRTQYLFGGLNDIKPEMVEQATRNAREVAEKFAADSNSQLGKLKLARQGQFSINNRDSNNPHIKQVRVVSTLEYYLAD